MADLPAELSTGTVHGRFIIALIDGNDAGQEPDVIPAKGTIRFKSSVPYVPVPVTTLGPVTVMKGPVVGVLDNEGYLCTPNPVTGEIMYRGVKLIATDDPDMAVTDWTWTAEYVFESVGSTTMQIPAHGFSLPSESTVDLTTVVKVPATTGYGLPQAEAAVLRAEASAAEAKDALTDADGVLDQVTLAASTVEADATRAEAAADRAEAPTDEMNKNLIENPASLTSGALSAAIDDSLYTAAGGTTTTGTNVRLAPAASLPSNVGTSGVIGGGHANYENVIGGIYANVNTAVSNLGGPALTGLNGNWAWIIGGYDNVVNGWACYVQGFHNRVGLDANHCTISGGSIHSMPAGTTYGTIGGGTTNEVSSNYSTVSGGRMNKATGVEATVLGGESNTASGNGSVAGGRKNVASGLGAYAVGDTNTASGPAGTVTGGTMNNATGDYSSVAGGYGNTASGRFTVASGRGAHANATGMKAHAGGSFSALGDAQAGDWILRRESTDATTTELFTENGFGRITLADGQSMAFDALIVAKSTVGESAGYKVSGLIERPAGSAAAAFIGTPTITVLGEDVAAWNVTLFAGLTDGTLRLQVTGEAGKTIRWVGRVSGSMVI